MQGDQCAGGGRNVSFSHTAAAATLPGAHARCGGSFGKPARGRDVRKAFWPGQRGRSSGPVLSSLQRPGRRFSLQSPVLRQSRPVPERQDASSLATVLSGAATREMVETIAGDPAVESRVRMLAFNRLRAMELPVPAKQLLGAIIEFPQDDGLDTLAAFADGRVRYINQTGKPAIFEDAPPDVVAKANALMRVSQLAVDRHGPADEPRRPPPTCDLVRLSFLVSDGLNFGEGSYEVLMDDPAGGPVLTAGGELLVRLVDSVVMAQANPGSRA